MLLNKILKGWLSHGANKKGIKFDLAQHCWCSSDILGNRKYLLQKLQLFLGEQIIVAALEKKSYTLTLPL